MTRYILDGQSFDLEGVRSLRENPRHLETNPFVSHNDHSEGCFSQNNKVAVFGDRVVALIEYRDGTLIDVVRQILPAE